MPKRTACANGQKRLHTMSELTTDQIRLISREVAREVVQELLGGAGVTMEDLIYLRKQREGSELAVMWIKRSAVTVAISSITYTLWLGIRAVLGK